MYSRRGLIGSALVGRGRSVFSVPTDAVGKIGSAASSRGRLLTVLQTSWRSNDELLRTSLMPRRYRPKSVRNLNLLPARLQIQNLFSPCWRHGSWMRCSLKCTLKCSQSICPFHGSSNHHLHHQERSGSQRVTLVSTSEESIIHANGSALHAVGEHLIAQHLQHKHDANPNADSDHMHR